MARPKKEDHPDRLERWAALLNHLKQQIEGSLDEQHKNELLLRFLSRNASDLIASLTSVERWLAGAQLPSPTTRASVASALGISKLILDGFLFKGIPNWEELSRMLPSVSQEYKSPSCLDIGLIDTRNENTLLRLVKLLVSYLSLSSLVELRDFISNQITEEISRLKLNISSSYPHHPLQLIIQENCIRSGGSERFIETVLSRESKDINRSSVLDIVTGLRLPTQKELKALSFYLKDEEGNYYSHEILAILLSHRLESRSFLKHDNNLKSKEYFEKTENGANHEGEN